MSSSNLLVTAKLPSFGSKNILSALLLEQIRLLNTGQSHLDLSVIRNRISDVLTKRFVRPTSRRAGRGAALLFREDDYPKVRMPSPAFLTYSKWGSFKFLGFFFSPTLSLSLLLSCLLQVTSNGGLKWVPQEVLMLPCYLPQSKQLSVMGWEGDHKKSIIIKSSPKRRVMITIGL